MNGHQGLTDRAEARDRHRASGERGLAAVELALVMPVIATLILATFDAAATARRAHEVHALAHAAAHAVVRAQLLPPGTDGNEGEGANIPPPNTSGGGAGEGLPALLGDLVTLPPDTAGNVRLFWGCGGLPPPPNQPACGDGNPFAPYVDVRVTGSVPRLVQWPGMLLPAEVEGRALVRLG
jgi:hypothetical protein